MRQERDKIIDELQQMHEQRIELMRVSPLIQLYLNTAL